MLILPIWLLYTVTLEMLTPKACRASQTRWARPTQKLMSPSETGLPNPCEQLGTIRLADGIVKALVLRAGTHFLRTVRLTNV